MLKFVTPLLLVLMFAVACLAQSSAASTDAVMVDSFSRVPNGQIRAVLDSFLADIFNRGKGTRGVVVNYGTVREVAQRTRLISNHFIFRGFDTALISYVLGGIVSEMRTDLWIVPAGASPPQIKPEAFVAGAFGRITKAKARPIIRKFLSEMDTLPDHLRYIILYGNDAQMAMQEKWVLSEISSVGRRHPPSTTIVRAGKRKAGIGTVMWLVPPGEPYPAP